MKSGGNKNLNYVILGMDFMLFFSLNTDSIAIYLRVCSFFVSILTILIPKMIYKKKYSEEQALELLVLKSVKSEESS